VNEKGYTEILTMGLVILIVLVIASLQMHYDDRQIKELGIDYVIAIELQHSTRVYMIYKDKNGLVYTSSVHCSATIKIENETIHVGSYLNGTKKCGAFENRKEEYYNYLRK